MFKPRLVFKMNYLINFVLVTLCITSVFCDEHDHSVSFFFTSDVTSTIKKYLNYNKYIYEFDYFLIRIVKICLNFKYLQFVIVKKLT